MTKQEFIDYLANNLTYEEIEMADAEAKAYAKGFKEGLEARKQGEWIFQECFDEYYGRAYECSICGGAVVGNHNNFCPNCGARMKGADDEKM